MRLILIGLAFFLFPLAGKCQPAYCQLSGAFFVEKDIARAQYKVYLEASESFADLLVFQAQNSLFADKPGCWYLTTIRAQANYYIIFVKERALADFSIHYIDTESFAGCQTSR